MTIKERVLEKLREKNPSIGIAESRTERAIDLTISETKKTALEEIDEFYKDSTVFTHIVADVNKLKSRIEKLE